MLRVSRSESQYDFEADDQFISTRSLLRRCPSMENLLEPNRIESVRLECETEIINDLTGSNQ